MLAEHPDVLVRLRKEVLETLGSNGKVGPEPLRGMKYLRAVLNGKQFTTVRRSFRLICRRDTEVVSRRVRISIVSSAHIRADGHSPWNIRCSKKDVVWPALDGGKPLYVPGGTPIMYLPWLMHRRKDLWGPDGEFPFITFLLLRTHHQRRTYSG